MSNRFRSGISRLRYAGVRKSDQAGFTLIEVLVVIVILGILTGTAILLVGRQTTNAAITACSADAKSLETAIEEYRSDNNGGYPAGPATTSTADPAWQNLLTTQSGFAGSPFLRDPIPTTHYVVWWDSSGQVYVDSAPSSLPFTYPTGAALITNPALTTNMDFNTSNGAACSYYAK